MSALLNTASHDSNQYSNLSLVELLKRDLSDPELTSPEKCVINALRLYIGYDLKKRISIKKISDRVALGESRTREILSSLVSKGKVIRESQNGRTNLWSFPESLTPPEVRRHLRPVLRKENVTESEDVFCHFSCPDPNPDPPPPKKPIRMDIVKALIDVTGDKRSFGLWCKVSRDVPLEEIRYCVEALRIALNDNSVSSPGRYLVGILKSRCPEVFQKQAVRASQQETDTHIPTQRRPQSKKLKVKQADWTLNQTNLEQIKRILRM